MVNISLKSRVSACQKLSWTASSQTLMASRCLYDISTLAMLLLHQVMLLRGILIVCLITDFASGWYETLDDRL